MERHVLGHLTLHKLAVVTMKGPDEDRVWENYAF